MIHENSIASHREHEGSGKGQTYREQIITLLDFIGDAAMTDREIINALGVEDVNNIRPEITRLKQRGVIRECGKVTCSFTGKKVRLVTLIKE